MMLFHRTYAILFCALTACGGDPDGGAGDRSGAGAQTADAPSGGETSPPGEAAATPAGDTSMEITGEVGGRTVGARGQGACEHAAEGSIYQRPASLWTARYEGGAGGDVEHLNLTFWRERAGAESFTLAVRAGGTTHRIATVEGGARQGEGRATLEGDASAGTFVVEGTSDGGEPVRLRIRCERFTTLVAEGG